MSRIFLLKSAYEINTCGKEGVEAEVSKDEVNFNAGPRAGAARSMEKSGGYWTLYSCLFWGKDCQTLILWHWSVIGYRSTIVTSMNLGKEVLFRWSSLWGVTSQRLVQQHSQSWGNNCLFERGSGWHITEFTPRRELGCVINQYCNCSWEWGKGNGSCGRGNTMPKDLKDREHLTIWKITRSLSIKTRNNSWELRVWI